MTCLSDINVFSEKYFGSFQQKIDDLLDETTLKVVSCIPCIGALFASYAIKSIESTIMYGHEDRIKQWQVLNQFMLCATVSSVSAVAIGFFCGLIAFPATMALVSCKFIYKMNKTFSAIDAASAKLQSN